MSFKRGWKLSDLFYLSSFMFDCVSFEKENKKTTFLREIQVLCGNTKYLTFIKHLYVIDFQLVIKLLQKHLKIFQKKLL